MKSTILLLVSDPVVRSVMKETLENEGYTVSATGDLGNAVDRLKEIQPDLLITRTYVEGLPGHDAAVYLRLGHRGDHVDLLAGGEPRRRSGVAEHGGHRRRLLRVLTLEHVEEPQLRSFGPGHVAACHFPLQTPDNSAVSTPAMTTA